jgi:hypothetical protein
MKLKEIQNQASQLSINDRWLLVRSLLSSIQQETSLSNPQTLNQDSLAGLDSWTQSLIGVIQMKTENQTELYVDYLEEKYS